MSRKLLKQFYAHAASCNIPLKQGINEKAAGGPRSAAFEGKESPDAVDAGEGVSLSLESGIKGEGKGSGREERSNLSCGIIDKCASALKPIFSDKRGLGFLILLLLGTSCDRQSGNSPAAADPQLQSQGSVEVSAQLVEIPPGAIFKRDLYDYATILKYKVRKVHRGDVKDEFLLVGHYNPWKPRSEAADAKVKKIGGNLRQFRAGDVHHKALEAPIDDYFMGGIVNKYFGQRTGVLYWAVWTNLE
jgi:hypothetical protein